MFAAMFLGPYPSIGNGKSNPNSPNTKSTNGQQQQQSATVTSVQNGRSTGPRKSHKYETPNRRFWGQETNIDSLYNVYLKKITYSSNVNDLSSTLTLPTANSLSPVSRSPDLHNHSHHHFHGHQHHHSHHQSRSNTINTEDRRRRSKSVDKSEVQCLQWETRQIRILKAATLEHIIEYILLLTPHQREQKLASNHHMSPMMEEERNDVSHVMHVLFCTYRIYCQPYDLFQILSNFAPNAIPEQVRFVLHYWVTNYPEDFMVTLPLPDCKGSSQSSITPPPIRSATISRRQMNRQSVTSLINNHSPSSTLSACSSIDNNSSAVSSVATPLRNSNARSVGTATLDLGSTSSSASTSSSSIISSYELSSTPPMVQSSSSTPSSVTNSSSTMMRAKQRSSSCTRNGQSHDQRCLIDSLLALPCLDDGLYRKILFVMKQCKQNHLLDSYSQFQEDSPTQQISSSRIIESDSKFIAQQLTAIDLENFLALKAYTLLNGPKHNLRVQNMIKNFNLLSKHVIVTILRAQSPDFCATQWINIAHHLRRMKNFNSLKAVIAGLTNESIFRLKSNVWSKLNRTTSTNFKNMSKIVDDVDNQTLLRQTQLEIEGTAKVSLEEESFGTIPYLGTFLTDLTVIDTKLNNYVENSRDPNRKLINLEKCGEQFEIVTQIHLLQKNIHAALTTYHHSRQLSGTSQLPTTPTAPRVSRVFRVWFNDPIVSNMTDNDCYKLSLTLEPPPSQKK
ncbi:uncharacterized protein LOC141851784 [Brevipalpus obovatus]|uniref:uncharacterized protein LOC141851784 n=1 Tax=Brevipalpus obovatus TaxID=246614 RepID=UPI003D9F968E